MRCVLNLLSRVFATRMDSPKVAYHVVKALAYDPMGGSRFPHANLAGVRVAMANMVVDNTIFGDTAGIVNELIHFQMRYLREKSGDIYGTQYMTTAELERWYVDMRDRISALVMA